MKRENSSLHLELAASTGSSITIHTISEFFSVSIYEHNCGNICNQEFNLPKAPSDLQQRYQFDNVWRLDNLERCRQKIVKSFCKFRMFNSVGHLKIRNENLKSKLRSKLRWRKYTEEIQIPRALVVLFFLMIFLILILQARFFKNYVPLMGFSAINSRSQWMPWVESWVYMCSWTSDYCPLWNIHIFANPEADYKYQRTYSNWFEDYWLGILSLYTWFLLDALNKESSKYCKADIVLTISKILDQSLNLRT